jgi:hypothetical protein
MVYPARHWIETFTRCVLPAISIAFLVNSPSLAEEAPEDVLAATVRQHGHACDKPSGAKPDPQDTSPDEKAWILHCEDGDFRVKFTGDTGATVEPLGE